MKNLIHTVAVILLLSACTAKQTSTTDNNEVYLFSYFLENGNDGLHLAYSTDGLTWEALNNGDAILAPQVGEGKLMRDPSIVQDENGTFHMVWTTGWWDNGIGYASSKDLIHWTPQQNIPVMENFKETKNTWAPEIFYDSKEKLFYIFWSSTIPGAFPELPTAENEKGLNHRQYYITTKDFVTFSETKLFFEPVFSVIDGSILIKDDIYYLFIKNENSLPAEKNIRMTYNNKPYEFPTTVSAPITGDYWAEGPAPLIIGDYVYIYFDKYMEGKYGAIRSTDMQNWEDISDAVTFPQGTRHGTAFKVSKEILKGLQQ